MYQHKEAEYEGCKRKIRNMTIDDTQKKKAYQDRDLTSWMKLGRQSLMDGENRAV